ncbi:unnamed protein product [Didymodactylos carnosus]|uniref:Uncharacterized protein n=1 Tax=Didymodactylos carnosus TaxID=1234261 RepID=A0A8S2CR01_9BILA|nr:unnamed protein product [Didymodactylos carnosus]CAF3499491.1 unnamed protein product [Didymodactylos carnosus]
MFFTTDQIITKFQGEFLSRFTNASNQVTQLSTTDFFKDKPHLLKAIIEKFNETAIGNKEGDVNKLGGFYKFISDSKKFEYSPAVALERTTTVAIKTEPRGGRITLLSDGMIKKLNDFKDRLTEFLDFINRPMLDGGLMNSETGQIDQHFAGALGEFAFTLWAMIRAGLGIAGFHFSDAAGLANVFIFDLAKIFGLGPSVQY